MYQQTYVQSVPKTKALTCGQYLLSMHGRQYLREVPSSVNGCHTIIVLKLAISTMLQQEMHGLFLHARTHLAAAFAADDC